MKPVSTNKAAETADYGGRVKRQYYAGQKRLLKRRAGKERRRCGKLHPMDLLIQSIP